MERKKILIADDTEINREMLKVIFGSDYEIMEAKDGLETIALINQYSSELDLLLLDLNMPYKTGFDVMQYMGEHGLLQQIPVIVITSSSDLNDELNAYNRGAAEIIRKPFVPKVILQRARNLMELYDSRKHLELELKKRTLELQGSQKYDPLTGLFRMQQFLESAGELLKEADRDTIGEYRFVYSNIRNFKYYNVKYGMEQGDEVLKEVARLIRTCAVDIISARFGQDHIVMMTKSNHLPELIQELHDTFERIYGYTGMSLKAGVYRIRSEAEKVSQACEFAKLACDSIRHTAECYCEYDEELGHHIEISTYAIQHLDEAIEKKDIQVFYQPVIRTINGKTCGMEALARWHDPEKGMLSPADFIPSLEENHQITKLDLCILRQACEDTLSRMNANLPTVPISINLSRYDFFECDIFSRVDEIVLSYGLPRDMINIEVTESAITDNPEALKRDIARFRDGGYQVWMDDFGSGYSSLNVLKDYQFDEIKLDMKFLSSLDEKSKKILRSIISMSKELGIQTLAEGVETQEQYDFLRDIGCEKVQGYLFSRPLPIPELETSPLTKEGNTEERAWKGYYNLVGASNFITDRPLSVVEFDGREFRFVYVNQAFREVWKSLGVTSIDMVYRNINSPSSPLSAQFRELCEYCHVGGGEKELYYSVRGRYVRLYSKCLAEYKNMSAFEVEIVNLTNSETEDKRTLLENTTRSIFTMFDTVYFFDLNRRTFEAVRQSAYKDQKPIDTSDTIEHAAKEAEKYIYPGEQAEYAQFIDLTNLKQRIEASGKNFVTKYFRTLIYNGAYVWKAHTILYVPDSNTAVYCSRLASITDQDLAEKLSYRHRNPSGEEMPHFESLLFQGLMESKGVNIFWKDANRRFLGANDHFLETYGFSSEDEIIGKTDEDMGWHIDDEPFAADERSVLEKGTVISNHIGNCIIKGVAHNIVVTKEPLFDEGRIVGLIGYFVQADQLRNEQERLESDRVVDQVTGLMSPQGLVNASAEYAEGWNIRGANFATIRINLTEYRRATQTYGEITAKHMLSEIGAIIAKAVGRKGTCARLYSGNFAVLIRCHDKHEIRNMAGTIKHMLSSVHVLSGYPVTLYPKVEISFADESEDVLSMIGIAASGAMMNEQQRESWSVDISQVFNTYEDISEVVYASDMDTYEIQYMNRVAREHYGVNSMEEVRGKKCYEFFQKCAQPCANCTNLQLLGGQPYEWEFFNPHVQRLFHLRDQMFSCDGQRIRIEVATEVEPEQTGHSSEANEHTLLMISECIRVALEESNSDTGLKRLIEYLGRTLSGERVYLFELSPDALWNNTYEWCAFGVTAQMQNLQNIPFEDVGMWNDHFQKGEFVIIKDIEEIREKDPVVYEYLKPQEIHSIIVGPLYRDGTLCGFYGIDNPPQDKIGESVPMLRTISHVIVTILERRDMTKRLETLSYIDALSSLGNRNAVNRFVREMDRTKSIGVVFCDVCGLKIVNDTMGHYAGDQLLIQTCNLLRECFEGYHLFRWGGDEFLVLADNIEEADLLDQCDLLTKRSMDQSMPLAIGSVWQNSGTEPMEQLINEADRRMYQNKRALYLEHNIQEILMKNELIIDTNDTQRKRGIT